MPLDEQDKQWIAETLAETLDSKLYAMETKLLRAFADYNVSAGIRFRKLEADVSNVDASSQPRIGRLEEKVSDIEIRLMRLEDKP